MKSKQKPYDLTPTPDPVASEPALAYAYAQDYDVETAPVEEFPYGVDATTPFVITQSGQKWWDVDLETAEELEVIIAGIKNGTMNLYPDEEVEREMKDFLVELNG